MGCSPLRVTDQGFHALLQPGGALLLGANGEHDTEVFDGANDEPPLEQRGVEHPCAAIPCR